MAGAGSDEAAFAFFDFAFAAFAASLRCSILLLRSFSSSWEEERKERFIGELGCLLSKEVSDAMIFDTVSSCARSRIWIEIATTAARIYALTMHWYLVPNRIAISTLRTCMRSGALHCGIRTSYSSGQDFSRWWRTQGNTIKPAKILIYNEVCCLAKTSSNTRMSCSAAGP